MENPEVVITTTTSLQAKARRVCGECGNVNKIGCKQCVCGFLFQRNSHLIPDREEKHKLKKKRFSRVLKAILNNMALMEDVFDAEAFVFIKRKVNIGPKVTTQLTAWSTAATAGVLTSEHNMQKFNAMLVHAGQSNITASCHRDWGS
ncbi:PREDICTED: uncharacterized protein LOC106806140 [Priapulus caudatus]|uniref:Uncharacterized protein LOC106806140 n=1 Tax=Priapulus caudatus TaxID=37621 RepID=A0ABM1DU66_PRICU|nr:PREDICTED: uncharacterized protein LOC106806140 [Priapulus caudatus]